MTQHLITQEMFSFTQRNQKRFLVFFCETTINLIKQPFYHIISVKFIPNIDTQFIPISQIFDLKFCFQRQKIKNSLYKNQYTRPSLKFFLFGQYFRRTNKIIITRKCSGIVLFVQLTVFVVTCCIYGCCIFNKEL